MARAEVLLFGPLGWSVPATGVGAVATSTKAAAVGKQHVISGLTISSSAVPGAAVVATLKDGVAGTILEQFELPITFAFLFLEFQRPYLCTVGNAAELSVPSFGGAVRVTTVLRGMTTDG